MDFRPGLSRQGDGHTKFTRTELVFYHEWLCLSSIFYHFEEKTKKQKRASLQFDGVTAAGGLPRVCFDVLFCFIDYLILVDFFCSEWYHIRWIAEYERRFVLRYGLTLCIRKRERNGMLLKNLFGHFMTITGHRHEVIKNCARVGLLWQGLKHDLSKYSPREFFQGVKYYIGTRSPNDGARAELGYSSAWMHHKGRNKESRNRGLCRG